MRRSGHRAVAAITAIAGAVLALPAGSGVPVAPGASATATAAEVAGPSTSYVVVVPRGGSMAAARAAVRAAGGTVTGEDAQLGLVTAVSRSPGFAARADADPGVYGVVADRVVGAAPRDGARPAPLRAAGVDAAHGLAARTVAPAARTVVPAARAVAPAARGRAVGGDPLSGRQWDMAAIGATAAGSYARQQGGPGVLVGVIDTGIDATHPDIAANFDAAASRNFVTDRPAIDGPCENPSCVDPVGEDDDGHGTHVAGTIGAPLNGVGIAGVAPRVTLVSIRAGQDSGFFFLEPVIKALRYAADAHVDVVNMSFYIDPWLFNCTANPADPPQAQMEQRAVIEATQRALDYAHGHGVTLVSALGNEHADLGRPGKDTTSPDYPSNAARTRTIDNSTCLNLPTEGRHVIAVAGTGPSGKKADYSDHGLEQTDLAAPGGFYRDRAGTASTRRPENLVLAPMPRAIALTADPAVIDTRTGRPVDPMVLASCTGAGPATCTYWQYLQGTSMASPHVAGVAALIVAQYGHRDAADPRGGLTLDPDVVERVLRRTATHVRCPAAVITYAAEGRDATWNAPCVGTAARNSIYGDGEVNAARAVGMRA